MLGTPPHGASPRLQERPRSEGGVSDADTEEISVPGQLSRFGSIASIGAGSEVSWTSALTSDGHFDIEDPSKICASRRQSW